MKLAKNHKKNYTYKETIQVQLESKENPHLYPSHPKL